MMARERKSERRETAGEEVNRAGRARRTTCAVTCGRVYSSELAILESL